MALFGATGTGKSTLLLNMALDLIGLGYGVSVMDPHGGLLSSLLDRLPQDRTDDVVLIRFADVAYPVGLNILTARPGFEFLTVDELMDKGKLLLVDLSGIGVSNAQFLGSLLTLLFHHAALSREDTPASQRRLHFLIMDECSWFISRTVGDMADQVRKFGLGLVLAAQRLAQLKPRETREAVFGNVGNLICFQMGDRDEASYLARHFNTPGLTANEIRSLGRYEIYAQLTQQGARLPAFWARTPSPPSPTPRGERKDQIEWLIQRSRQSHALPRVVVEERIASRERRERHEEPEKRRRQGPAAAHDPRPGHHPGRDNPRPDDASADPVALLPQGW